MKILVGFPDCSGRHCVFEVVEQALIQTLVTQMQVEALDLAPLVATAL